MRNALRYALAVGVIAALVAAGIYVAQQPATGAAAYAPYGPTTIRVATYNALGYSHTDLPTGNERWRLGGVRRTDLMHEIFVNRGIDLAGVQEFQNPQHREWRRVAGRQFGLYCPPTPRRYTGHGYSGHNCIVWRRAVLHIVRRSYMVIPYFYGRQVRMPVATFRSVKTGAYITADSVHNPTSSWVDGNQLPWRLFGWWIEARRAAEFKSPAVLFGDRNQTAPGYLPRVASTFRVAGRRGIDWIDGHGVRFSGYYSTRSGLVATATDHPIVVAEATF